MIDAPQPQDPCPCGSNLPYAECHQAINEASDEELLSVARKNYALRWGGNSSFYESQGLYAALARHLFMHVKPSRLLDIGCGRGEGLVALQSIMQGQQPCLIGIDENPDCLEAAAARLGLARPAERLRKVSANGRNYDLELISGLIPNLTPIMLLQSDIRRPDAELDHLLMSLGKLDAITLWFNGVHPARQFDVAMQRCGIGSDKEARMASEIDAIDCACHLIRPGGVLHIVGRGAAQRESALYPDVRSNMSDLIADYPLSLSNLTLYQYREPSKGPRIGVREPGTDFSLMKTFATSAIFVVNA